MKRASLIQKIIILLAYALLPIILRHIYYLRLLNLLIFFTSFTLSSNIIFGHTRQLFLCQGALIGIGAYVSAILPRTIGVTPWIIFPVGAIISAGVGTLLSVVSFIRKLSIIFVAVLTLSFQIIFAQLILGLRFITGADEGIVLRHEILRGLIGFHRELSYYYLLVAILFALINIYDKIVNSRLGVAFRCIIEDETAASFIGINVVKYKALSAFIGSFIFGFMGGIYAYYNLFICLSMFENIDALILVMLVFGGMGTLIGPLLGAGVFTLVFEFLRPLGPMTTLIFGIILIILFLYFREGLVSRLKRLLASR